MTIVVNSKYSKYDVYVGRPSKYGNPFILGRHGTRDQVIEKFRAWFYTQPSLMVDAKQELVGKRLGCHCSPKPCHADVLVEYVDAPQ